MKPAHFMLLSSLLIPVAHAHPGHEHESGIIAALLHAIAGNEITLAMIAAATIVIGVRLVSKRR